MPDQAPFVSIIVVNYNCGRIIKRCLNSVLNSNYPNYEVIVIDNNSIDGSLELIEKSFSSFNKLRIVRLKHNVGFAMANNIAALRSRGKYLVFLNPDTVVNGSWLNELVNLAESRQDIGALQSKLMILDEFMLDGIGDFPSVHGISFILGHRTKDRGNPFYCTEIFSARAAAMLVGRDLFLKIGGFDPDYFIGYEDVDLGWRIRLLGRKVCLVPTSIVYHVGRAITAIYSDIEAFHKHKNCIMTVMKNYNFKNLLINLPFTVLLRLFLSIAPLKETRRVTRIGFSGIRAVVWILVNMRKIWQKRLFVQKYIRRVPDANIKNKMLPTSFWVDMLRWWLFFSYRQTDFWNYLYYCMLKYVLR